MLRRKLFIYTIMYAAGISAGYFIFERARILEASGLMLSLALEVILADTDRGKASGTRLKEENRQKIILIIMLISGFLIFYSRNAYYNRSAAVISGRDEITAKVMSVQIRGDRARLTVRTSDPGSAGVIVSLSTELFEEGEDDPDNCSIYSLTGAVIEARGVYKELEPADNPGCFDYRLYMRSKGVSAGFRAYSAVITDTRLSAAVRLKRYLYLTRESFINRFDDETRGFIRGVIFGDKTDIDEDVIREFNNNSTGHILAVSGLHMGFLYGLLRALTGRRRTLPVSLLIVAIILLYGEMTMWSPATVRASIVMTISLLSVHLRRRSDLLTSVSLAAFLILTYEPYQLFNSGFQMSFLALVGIAFFSKPISTVTGEVPGTMLAVQIGTLPVSAYTFGCFDPLSVFINVPMILLSAVLVPACIILLLMEALFGICPSYGIDAAELISYTVIKINHILNFSGAFSFTAAGHGTMAIAAFYVLAFAASSEWMRIKILRKDIKPVIKTGLLLLMSMLMLSSCLFDRLSDDDIVFVAVGQGDCTHIRAGQHNVLIDGGGVPDFGDRESYSVGEKILKPYLIREGAGSVDIALVTHLHADHYKGIAELSDVFPIGAIGVPVDYSGADLSAVTGREKGDKIDKDILYIRPETEISLSERVSVEVIWPMEVLNEPLSSDDPNEHNTVYMINYDGVKIMVTGDLLEEDEQEMVRYYEGTDKLKCDILKVAHHGSKSSTSVEFLDAASPSIAVIQVGRDNFYGHPHRQTLDRLEERGIEVFRTDISGAVGIDIRDGKISVDLFRNVI